MVFRLSFGVRRLSFVCFPLHSVDYGQTNFP